MTTQKVVRHDFHCELADMVTVVYSGSELQAVELQYSTWNMMNAGSKLCSGQKVSENGHSLSAT